MKTDSIPESLPERLPERLVEMALKGGAGQAEAFMRTSKRLSVEVKGGAIEAVESSVSLGYSVRVIRDGRLGFSYSTDPGEWQSVAEAALESSKWTERDEFLDLPVPPSSMKFESPEVFDPEADRLVAGPGGRETAFEKALLIEKGALKDGRIKKLRNAQAAFSSSETAIYNSKGIDARYASTSCSAQVMAVAEEAGDSQSGWDFETGRSLSGISFEKVGETAAVRAVRLLGARKITPVKARVALENSVSAEFLGIFAAMLSSDAVQKGKSLLRGKTGQKIAGECINIIDDGLLKGRSGSRPFDDEGVAARKKTLVTGGVLAGYMYNTYTARKDGVSSTGNAIRGGFSGVPSVGPTNLYIESSETVSDIITSLGTGLYITEAMGAHTANPISGDFSVGVSGLWVEGGEVSHPVKEAVLSGNMLSFFGSVTATGRDLVFYGNIGSPSLLVGPVDISG